jgi:ubiquinone/menaquinone biosynthesis C-methylase UbiE
MRLLPQSRLVKTGPVDHADWNYRGVLGIVQRQRFIAALSLIPRTSDRLLELGYGSGVFFPALIQRAKRLYGIDIHDKANEVQSALQQEGVSVYLACTGAEKIPFADGSFETVVAISALEFVSDLKSVCTEVCRILKPGGTFVVITPGKSKLVDLGLRILTGESATKDFGNRRENLVTVVSSFFKLTKKIHVPRVGYTLCTFYTALQFRKEDTRRLPV